MKTSVLLLFSLLAGFSFAENDTTLLYREKQLSAYLDALRNASNDMDKEAANQQFKTYLYATIQLKGAFEYPFSSLKSIGTIKSPDNSFRLFNWNVEQDDETHKYYCYILRYDERKHEWKTIELTDNSMMLPPQPEDVLDENMWYGALYYKIIPIERSGKTMYTLLGYDANNNMSHVKLIDVLSFSGNHAKLGSPIFKTREQTYKRMFFEHSRKCVMSLNYDEARQKIIFDHLSPESPGMEGFREFYVPDMSYDALKFSGNKWILEEDIIGINKKQSGKPATVTTLDLTKEGKLVRHQQKATWVDPSNANAPAGQQVHKAALPEEETTAPEKQKSKKEASEFPPVRKGSKKHKSAVSGISGKKKY